MAHSYLETSSIGENEEGLCYAQHRKQTAVRRRTVLVITLLPVCSLSAIASFEYGVRAGLGEEAETRSRQRVDEEAVTQLRSKDSLAEEQGLAAWIAAGGNAWGHEDKPRRGLLLDLRESIGEGWPCTANERLFENMCYVACDKVTQGKFPYRIDTCTCCKSFPCQQSPGNYIQNCIKLDKGSDGLEATGPVLSNCRFKDEELFEGLCYLKCSILTANMYSLRTGMNTCSDDSFGGNWTMGAGACSGFGVGGDECIPHIPMPVGVGHMARNADSHVHTGVPPLGLKVSPQFQGRSLMPPEGI